MATGNECRPLIYVVDDDEGLCDALTDFFELEGFEARFFLSGDELLAATVPSRVDCLLLDVELPGSSGLDLQQHLADAGSDVPIVFMTGYGDVPTSVRAMKGGASDFLTKPLRNADLRTALIEAMEAGVRRKQAHAAFEDVEALVSALSPRERQVMKAVVGGLLNKQIAYELGIAEITVKLHRRKVMRKMLVSSVTDLVKKSELQRQGWGNV